MLTIYGASAGSGKTFQLTQSYIALLFLLYKKAISHPHRRILAVTFTNKATEEMKSRIVDELFNLSEGKASPYRESLAEQFAQSQASINQTAKRILTDLLHDYAYFSISTIDKFFLQIVRTFGRELGIAGNQNVFLDTDEILRQATDNFFLNLTKEKTKSMQWLGQFMETNLTNQKNWRVKDEIITLGKELFKENYQTFATQTHEKLHDKDFLKKYQSELHSIKKGFENKINDTVIEFQNFLQSVGITEDIFKGKYLFAKLEQLKKGKFELSKSVIGYAESVENCYTKSSPIEKKSLIESNYTKIQKYLNTIIELLEEPLSDYNTADIILKNIYTLGLLSDLATEIKTISDEQNIIILSNINALLNKVIDKSETPFIYERTGLRVRHFMIDEFQDTSALQWKNFKPLIANSLSEGKSNLLVGDVKQSIYRWRNSDWKLMQEQVENEVQHNHIQRETLTHNWRSDKNIVSFNNLLFKQTATILSQQLQSEIESSIGTNSQLIEQLPQKIIDAYKDVEQKITSERDGFVQLTFIPATQEQIWQEIVLEKIPTKIEELIDKGYKPSDIAFLVRKKSQAVVLTNFMMQYKKSDKAKKGVSYDLIGNEGLKLSSSPTVGFIISLLKLILNPKDDIQYIKMLSEYQKAKHIPLDIAAQPQIEEKLYPPFFSDAEKHCIETIKNRPIYEGVEQIISTFQLEKWYGEYLFLNAFQDEIFQYSNHKTADLFSFLKWWDNHANNRYVNLPENENAMQVMTIHKSKGLDFKIVIMPFLDWDFEPRSIRPLLWLKPNKSPFDQLEQLPIHYSSQLKNTAFKTQYFDEKMHQYVDNLNLIYVAFTRARNGVIYFTPQKKELNKIDLSKTIQLPDILLSQMHTLFAQYQSKEDENVFQIGEILPPPTKKQSQEDNHIYCQTTNYPIYLNNERIKLKKTTPQSWEEKPAIHQDRVEFGIIMHEILQHITDRKSQGYVIEQLIREGKIRHADKQQIEEELERFWALPQVEKWFDPQANIYNETTILLPNKKIYRPDKVVIKGEKALVIDYKFGEKEQSKYQKQVSQYKKILQEMGYSTEGYIYYVSLRKIVKCT